MRASTDLGEVGALRGRGGITPPYLDVRALPVASGIGISDIGEQRRSRVVVLGANLAQELYGTGSPLGTRLQINGTAFRVIGVLAAKGSGMGSPDDSVFVPRERSVRA